MRPPSFTNKMQGNLSPMRRTPMLEQVNTLPGSQGELPLTIGIVSCTPMRAVRICAGRAFVGVPISAVVLRRQAVEKCLEIGANVPRGVLLYEQSGGGVPAK